MGLCVRNYRSSARIANIDVSNLKTSNAAKLIDLMIDAYYRIEEHAVNGKTVIYANKEIRTALHKQALDKANRNLTLDEVGGKPIIKFLGIPIKSCSEILNTEARVQ